MAKVDEELPGRLHAAALRLSRRSEQDDASDGISSARLSALSSLVFGGGRTIGALADAEGVTAPTMTRLVAGMERDGIVVRAPDPSDRRAVRLEATPAGRRLLLDRREGRVASMRSLLTAVRPKDRKTLAKATIIMERMLETPRAD
jgi:DNA-binding MarR family transcriptional regulator